MPFEFESTKLNEVLLVKPRVFGDDRGYFLETFKSSEFRDAGISEPMVQGNHSHSIHGVLRGLHYQLPPFAQGKLVRCIRGEIFDVAVDIRKSSPQFGQWFGYALTGENQHMLYIPSGFAHGFYTVSDAADVMYLTTAEYSKEHDRGILWNDPEIGIVWPSDHVLLSDKDQLNPVLKDAEVFG